MEARSQKIRGLNLNLLAPAQSKRTFAFSGKTVSAMENVSISAPFSVIFWTFFEAFPEKSKKRSRVGSRAIKIPQNGPQRHPNGGQEHQVRKTWKIVQQGWQSEAPSVTMESQGPPKCKKNIKKVSNSANKARKCAARCRKTHKHT